MFRSTTSRLGRFARLVGKTACPPLLKSAGVSSPRKARLSLEAFEAREVPALFTWTGVVSDRADDPGNWEVTAYEGEPSPGSLPGYNDDVLFAAVSSGNFEDCYDLTTDGTGPFKSLKLAQGYDGTVWIMPDSTFTVGAFTLEDGAIAQPAPSTPLSITGLFTWTGGTLNSLSNGAVVHINGGGAITSDVGETLTAGSTLYFGSSDGTEKLTLIRGGGTVLLTSTAENAVFVNANADVQEVVEGGNEEGLKSVNAMRTKLTLTDAKARYGFVGTGSKKCGLMIVNNGGTFYLGSSVAGLASQVSITLTAGDANTPVYTQGNKDAKLVIMAGCVLDVSASKGVSVSDGYVWTLGHPQLLQADQIATIKGTFAISGGNVGFPEATIIRFQIMWMRFRVDGNTTWSGGTFSPGVNCAPGQQGEANQWITTGTLTIDASGQAKPKITPTPIKLPDGQQPNGNWDVLKGGTTMGDAPIPEAGWEVEAVMEQNVKKGYRIKKG